MAAQSNNAYNRSVTPQPISQNTHDAKKSTRHKISRKLYKYLPLDVFARMFRARADHVALKCNFPKNYNDPFELFLSVNGQTSDEEVIAYYLEILGEIPQMPISCFSRKPDIVPMWAHYGREHRGFVVELDEQKVADAVTRAYIANVRYSGTSGMIDLASVEHAAMTLKPRHTFFAQSAAFRSAYFTKNRCWSYEVERRLVVDPENVETVDGIMLLYLPKNCVSAVISGARTTRREVVAHRKVAGELGCDHYQLMIGRSTFTPYFVGAGGNSFSFGGRAIRPAEFVCGSCSEPIASEAGECSWCAVDDGMRADAAMKNPLRMLHRLGIQTDYGFAFAGLRQIGTQTKRRSV